MSGGHWGYGHSVVRDHLDTVGADPQVIARWPLLATLWRQLAEIVYDEEREMDYALSGDTGISDDRAFECAAVGRILDMAMKAAPDAWFPRGKWATIQAVQGRMEKVEEDR